MSIQTSDAALKAVQVAESLTPVTYDGGNFTIGETYNGSTSTPVGGQTVTVPPINGTTQTLAIAAGTGYPSVTTVLNSAAGAAQINITTLQTSTFTVIPNLGDGGGNGITVNVTADSVVEYDYSFFVSAIDPDGTYLNVSCMAADTIDCTDWSFFGSGIPYGNTLTAGNVTTLILPPGGITLGNATDSWLGNWTTPQVDAILTNYQLGGSSMGALIITGASPSSAGLIIKAALITAGVSVSTN